MAALLLPSRRAVQPQGPVEINWANPITRGLAWAGTPSSGNSSIEGTIGQSNGLPGRSWETTGVPTSWVSTGYTPPTSGPLTSMVMVDRRVDESNRPCIAVGDRATISYIAGEQVQFFTYDGSGWDGPIVAAPVADGPTVFVGRHTGSDNFIDTRVWAGSSAGTARSGSLSVFARSHSALELTIGGEVENPFRTTESSFFIGAFWNRVLSDAEVRSIEENPWQIFKPIERRIWVDAVGGGVQTLLPPLTTRARTVYAPTVSPGAVTLSPPLTTRARTVYSPTAKGLNTLLPPLTTRTRTAYAPTVVPGSVTLLPSLVTRTRVVYEPVVSQPGAGAQDLFPPLTTRTRTVYAPIVIPGDVGLLPPLVTRTRAVYAPTVTTFNTLLPPLTTRTRTVYAPTVAVGTVTLFPPLVTRPRAVYPPTLTGGIPVVATGGLFLPIVRRRRR